MSLNLDTVKFSFIPFCFSPIIDFWKYEKLRCHELSNNFGTEKNDPKEFMNK